MNEINSFNVVWLSLTYRCNSRCVWCYAGSNNYELMKDKLLETRRQGEIAGLLEKLEVPRVILIGGEPSIYPTVAEFTANLSDAGIKVGMVSNGRKFKDARFARTLKESGLISATFSIEGSCAEIHDATSQVKGSFEEVMRGAHNAVDSGIVLSSNTVISQKNVNDLEKTIDTLDGMGFESMSFNISGVCVGGNNEYMLHPRDAIGAFERAYRHASSKGIKTRLVTPVPLCFFDNGLLPELKRKRAIGGTPCQLSHGKNFVLDYNGDIVPCTHLTGYPLFNAFLPDRIMQKEEFLREYNSSSAQDFRKSMTRYASSRCEPCQERCSGGCPLFWIKFDPEKELANEPPSENSADKKTLSLPILRNNS